MADPAPTAVHSTGTAPPGRSHCSTFATPTFARTLTADYALIFALGHATNGYPVLLAHIFINLNDATIEAITASLLAAGDSEFRPPVSTSK